MRTLPVASMLAVTVLFATGPAADVAKAADRPAHTRPAPPRSYDRPPTSMLAPARTSREPRGVAVTGA